MNKRSSPNEKTAIIAGNTAPDGRLKVSFRGLFYGAYNIISLDKKDYSHAMVCGPTRSYLWILARNPDMPESLKNELVKKTESLGFETGELIFVTQTLTASRFR